MYNGRNEYVPYKKRTKRSLNDHRIHMRYSSRKLCYRSCSWPFTTEVERSSMDTYRIPSGCRTHENRTNRTRTGQAAYQRMSNVHPPYIFISWSPFEVLNMSKTCQRIGPDKTDITWHGTHSPHGEWTRKACKQTRLLSITHPWVLSGKVWSRSTDKGNARRTDRKMQKMFIRWWKSSQWCRSCKERIGT